MASACVNKIGMSPDNFLDCPPGKKYSSYGWLSPRISFSRDFPDEESSKAARGAKLISSEKDKNKESDPEEPSTSNDFVDFEFRLEDPVNMLPADELFSDGKLVPLQLSMIRSSTASEATAALEVRSPPGTPKIRRRGEISATDPYLFSPKAPRCSSRWKELLGLKKKLYQNRKQENQKTTSSSSNSSNTHHHKSLKHFLHRNSKSSSLPSSLDSSSSLSLPLLRETDSSESVSVSSSRLSLSSSSSGHEHDDLPRLSLDSEKPTSLRLSNQGGNATGNSNGNGNPPRVRVAKPRALSSENPMAMLGGRSPVRRAPESTIRGVSVDSPRMNSSGKVVFHSLERSSSSPSSFNGGPRHNKHNRGMERSYSANVRVTPVLNVPVCSLRGSSKSGGVFGFPFFSSSSFQPKKEGGGGGSTNNSGNGTGNRGQQNNYSINRNRPDRT